MTIWRMHITYWIPKTTGTYVEHVIFIAFPLQQWLHGMFAYIACLVSLTIQCVDVGFVSGRSCCITSHPTAQDEN
jgi:hypothetical protein